MHVYALASTTVRFLAVSQFNYEMLWKMGGWGGWVKSVCFLVCFLLLKYACCDSMNKKAFSFG